MPQQVACPHCAASLQVPNELGGKLAACPKCNGQFHVPLLSNVPYATELAAPPSGTSSTLAESGFVKHVRIVAILLMVQGGLECLMAPLFLIGGLAASADFHKANDPPPEAAVAVGILLAIVIFGTGLVKLIAGIKNYKWRGRTLGIVAFGTGLLSLCTVYCAPTAIALGVYGLIVYLDKDVVAKFSADNSRHRYRR